MRSLNLRCMLSFITREHTLDISSMRSLFIAEHEKHLQLQPAWNPKATRRMVIANYWFREALMHFGVIMAISVLFTLPQCNSLLTLFGSTLLASLTALISLTAFIYFPSFYWNFLPKLEVV